MNHIACGNHAVHESTRQAPQYHTSVAEVRACFATPGGVFSIDEWEALDQSDSTFDHREAELRTLVLHYRREGLGHYDAVERAQHDQAEEAAEARHRDELPRW
jgi:hypothetical protein